MTAYFFQTSFARYYITSTKRSLRAYATFFKSRSSTEVSLRENRKSIALSIAQYRWKIDDIKKKGCMHIALRQIAIFYEFNRLPIRVSFFFLLPWHFSDGWIYKWIILSFCSNNLYFFSFLQKHYLAQLIVYILNILHIREQSTLITSTIVTLLQQNALTSELIAGNYRLS